MACSLAVIFFIPLNTTAIEFQETPKEMSTASVDFPAKGFNFGQCSERIPVRKGKNPWLRVDKKKSKPSAMNPASASWVESYFVTAANTEKHLAIINQEDSIYSSPTTLARIDCKNGLIYFQHLVREPSATNYFRVFDLVTGEEYQVTEGAVTISPDGRYLLTATASDQDQKCGRSANCDVEIKLFQCKLRKSSGTPCALQETKKYSVSRKGKAVAFAPLPVHWNWNKFKKQLKVSLGGSSRSPSKLKCDVIPKFSCKPAKKGALHFVEKG